MLSNAQIYALEAVGFKRWTKGNHDRLYINARDIPDIHIEYHKYANRPPRVSCDNETYGCGKSACIIYSKTYIDVKTGELTSDNTLMTTKAEELMDKVLKPTSYDRKSIMTRAWAIKRQTGCTMSVALKQAWAEAKSNLFAAAA